MAVIDDSKKIGIVNYGWSQPIDRDEWIDQHRRLFLCPEQNLLLAVLEDAINWLEHPRGKEDVRARMNREVLTWVQKDDDDWVFSFSYCCEAVGLNPSAVRRRILDRHGERVRKAA